MPGIILGASFLPPAPPTPVLLWPGISAMTWTGWDGSVWDLIGAGSGAQLQRGVRGLFMPHVDQYSSSSPAMAGSRAQRAILPIVPERERDRNIRWVLTYPRQPNRNCRANGGALLATYTDFADPR